MILLRDKNKNVLQNDYIRLYVDDDNENVIYVSRQVYDQAVILTDRFEGDCNILAERLQLGDAQSVAIEYFIEVAPEPLKILAPFLAFVEEKLELPCELEVLCGALHQMSTVINFENIVKVPKEVRANVDFTKRFILDYTESWNALEQKLTIADINLDNIKLDALESVLSKVYSLVPAQTVVTTQVVEAEKQVVSENVETNDEVEEIPDFFAELLAETKAEDTKKEEHEKAKEKPVVKQEAEEKVYAEETEEDKINQLIQKYGGA